MKKKLELKLKKKTLHVIDPEQNQGIVGGAAGGSCSIVECAVSLDNLTPTLPTNEYSCILTACCYTDGCDETWYCSHWCNSTPNMTCPCA